MVSAITGSLQRPSLTLDAQLARCQQKLSDSVNCASASTSEGQAQIAELSSRIRAIRDQLSESAPGYNARGAEPPAIGTGLDTFA